MAETWEYIESFPDEIAAEAFAGALRAEGVSAEVVTQSPVPGLVLDVKVRVPAAQAHRAQWVLKSLVPSESELIKLATGEVTGDD